MKTKPIVTPNFAGRIAKIIADVQASTCIDNVEAEVIEAILKDELNEYCMMLNGYYEEEYYNELSSARNNSYDNGYDDGYDVGYDNGYSDSHSAG